MFKKFFNVFLIVFMLLEISCIFSCSKSKETESEIVLSPDEQKLLVALDAYRNVYYKNGYEYERAFQQRRNINHNKYCKFLYHIFLKYNLIIVAAH